MFAVGLGELTAALIAPGSGPFVVVGSALIDLAPGWAKDTAIALFGTNDKAALLVGIGIVLLLVAAGAGLLEAAAPPWGRVVFGALGAAGVVAAMTRAGAGPLAIVPSAIAGLAGAIAVMLLVQRLPVIGVEPEAAPEVAAPESVAPESVALEESAPEASGPRTVTPEASARPAGPAAEPPDRRRFLMWAGGATAIGLLAAAAGWAGQAGRRAVQAVRDALVLPAPTATADIPAGAQLAVDGLSPLITPNPDFYRIDTALRVPEVDPADWSLRIHGAVAREVVITWDDLLALPMSEVAVTLACVSNEVGGGLIGNALWLGTPIRDLLARAAPTADADMVLSRSIDGFTAGTPLGVLQDPERDAILAIGMNGEPLPFDHGFPVRMVVPGLYGYVSATKWVTELEVTRFDEASAYWTDRGWSAEGPIKLSSRIDVPRRSSSVPSGRVVVAGVAWHQHTGIAAVEVQVDDSAWYAADLAPAISSDTWVQWRWEWQAPTGAHTLRVRATGADGEVQTDEVRPVTPDGATGLHEISVSVG